MFFLSQFYVVLTFAVCSFAMYCYVCDFCDTVTNSDIVDCGSSEFVKCMKVTFTPKTSTVAAHVNRSCVAERGCIKEGVNSWCREGIDNITRFDW